MTRSMFHLLVGCVFVALLLSTVCSVIIEAKLGPSDFTDALSIMLGLGFGVIGLLGGLAIGEKWPVRRG